MKVTRDVHHLWKTWEELKNAGFVERMKQDPEYLKMKEQIPDFDYPAPIMGKWHYHYESDDGKKHISLVELLNYLMPWRQGPQWEICSGGTIGECADAEERFSTREKAEERIKELMHDNHIEVLYARTQAEYKED